MNNHIVVLGGGITGLSLLWYLKKKFKGEATFTLLEKTSRVGGWIRTVQKEGILFECGPRSCRGNSKAAIQLIQEVGLEDQVLPAHPASRQRYLYFDQRLQKIPSGFISSLFSPLTRAMIPEILSEWNRPPGRNEDETIHSFFTRRFGVEIVNTFIDPLVSGIYAGNPYQLSVKSCFPHLYNWEQRYSSLLKGALYTAFKKRSKKTAFEKKMAQAGLFSFREGLETLPKALFKQLNQHILTDHEVERLNFSSSGIELQLANGKKIQANQVYSTLPAHALSLLVRPFDNKAADVLRDIPCSSIAIVGLAYRQNLFPHQGFGYLIPSKEKEKILGVVWDSCVFPEQNVSKESTRLTVMLGGARMQDFNSWSEQDFIDCALEALARHLNIKVKPDVIHIQIAKAAIPQYELGHERKKLFLESAIKTLSPHFRILGSSLYGVSINDCISSAEQIVYNTN